MMTRAQYLLGKLAEECAEVDQRASKAALFGIDEKQPGQPYNNKERLIDEIQDLRVIVNILINAGVLPIILDRRDRLDEKTAKVEAYYDYSVSQGCGEPREY
jgi:hypothetical protein